MSIEGIDEDEMYKRISESPFSYEGKCLCRDFFEEDVLDECTCPFDGYYGIVSTLDLGSLYTAEAFRKKAKAFLSNEYKFVLREYWCGFILLTDGKVY